MIRRAISDGGRASASHLSTLSPYVNPPSAASLRAEITSARTGSGYLSSQLDLSKRRFEQDAGLVAYGTLPFGGAFSQLIGRAKRVFLLLNPDRRHRA
ncbi:hypothetical protein D3C80_1453740 [compost metagenome]